MRECAPRQPEPEFIDLPEEAAAYAHADFAEVNQAFVDRLIEQAGDLPSARCIDLGTGPADIPIRLLKQRPGWRVTAIDASPPMLGFARHAVEQAGLGGAIQLLQADAKDTGLPARSFDVILSNSILHHVNDTLRFWREVSRLGADGATVFLRDLMRPPTLADAKEIVRRHAGNESPLLQKEFTRSLMAAYTPEEVRRQLISAGLKQLRVEVVTDRHLDIFGQL